MKPFDVLDLVQGSPEWLAARAGLVTGSCASAVTMGKDTAGRRDYILQLAIERIKGEAEIDDYQNRYMKHGKEVEPMARIAIEEARNVVIHETGFLRHKTLAIGASLDGHLGDYITTVEIKCPKSTTHVKYMQAGNIPSEYRVQVMHGLYITQAKTVLFASYDDRMPQGLELFSVEVPASAMPIELYEKALLAFLTEVEDMQGKLLEMRKRHG